jgi:ribosome recycling factor
MKATLRTITEGMTGSTELAEILNENFETLNEHQHHREDLIRSSLSDMQKSIDRKFQAIDKRFDSLESDIKKILNHLSGKKLLTEE